MATIKITFELPSDVEQKMTNGFIEYEKSHGIDVNYKRFSLLLYDSEDYLLGVLNAYTAFAEIYIDDLWIDGVHRKKGYGKKLVDELEKLFQGKGFNNINLVTSQFQAPDFYRKCGFQEEFVRINHKNPKLTKYFFVKYFKDEVQTQGLIKG